MLGKHFFGTIPAMRTKIDVTRPSELLYRRRRRCCCCCFGRIRRYDNDTHILRLLQQPRLYMVDRFPTSRIIVHYFTYDYDCHHAMYAIPTYIIDTYCARDQRKIIYFNIIIPLKLVYCRHAEAY